jgi:hypothetical protein
VWELVAAARSRLTPEQSREAERLRKTPQAWTESEEMDEARRRHAVQVAEAYADGRATEEQLRLAWKEADDAAIPYGYDVYNLVVDATNPNLELNGHIAATAVNDAPDPNVGPYCEYLRCIYGNPYRPVAFDPRSLPTAVVDLACIIYDKRAFDRLPILAEALMDAGCNDKGMLAHCRGPGPHVRGCWVVDFVLAKR